MSASENQIVVYQPNETVRLDVRLENETVWLTQAQLCELFGVVKSNVSYHLKNVFGTNELDYEATVQKIRTVRYWQHSINVSASPGWMRARLSVSRRLRLWRRRVARNDMAKEFFCNCKYGRGNKAAKFCSDNNRSIGIGS